MSFNQKGQTKKLLKLLKRIENPCCDCPDISEDEGNVVECRDDGLFVSEPEVSPQSFSITALASSSTQTDGATQLFLSDPTTTGTIYDQKSVTMIRDCILTSVLVEAYASSLTPGSAEPWSAYIRVNDTTDFLIQTLSQSTAKRVWQNDSINITLNAGDTIVIKMVNPTWANNPASTRFTGYLIFNAL